jgi:hypothetical protein
MSLSFKELQILRKEIERLRKRGEMLDPHNPFERRELQSIIRRLREIAGGAPEKPKVHLKLVVNREGKT